MNHEQSPIHERDRNTSRPPFIHHHSSFIIPLGLATVGLVLALAWPRPAPTVGGEIRESPPRETFLSGGARSEIVLREISETLHRIDLRLERFEHALRDAGQRPPDREPSLPGADQQPDPGQAPGQPNRGDNP